MSKSCQKVVKKLSANCQKLQNLRLNLTVTFILCSRTCNIYRKNKYTQDFWLPCRTTTLLSHSSLLLPDATLSHMVKECRKLFSSLWSKKSDKKSRFSVVYRMWQFCLLSFLHFFDIFLTFFWQLFDNFLIIFWQFLTTFWQFLRNFQQLDNLLTTIFFLFFFVLFHIVWSIFNRLLNT
jgi:hypothetical protein